MSVYQQNLEIDQGADFALTTQAWVVAGQIVDLTSYTAAFTVRQQPTSTPALLSLTNSITSSGSVTPNGPAGTVTIAIAHGATAKLPANVGPLQYDLIVTSAGGVVTRLMSGRVLMQPSITH